MPDRQEKIISYATIVGFGILYLVFPTNNSTSDAYGYATGTAPGAHHLLYDWLCNFVFTSCGFHGDKTLAILKAINAIFAASSLFIFYRLLSEMRAKNIVGWIFVAASCFGFMRFSTENETYILPIFFSLFGTYYLLLYEKENRSHQLILSFLLLAIGVLFHQMHIFWALAATASLLFRTQFKWKHIIVPLSAGILVLSIHIFSAINAGVSLSQWLFRDVYDGLVELTPGVLNFKLTAINFMRSFIQFHGNIAYLGEFALVSPSMVLSLILFVTAIVLLLLRRYRPSFRKDSKLPITSTALLFAFVLHLVFAWYSVGNAEFMVMLPILAFLYLAGKFNFSQAFLYCLGSALFLWNLATAIVPAHFLDYEKNLLSQNKMMKRGPQLFISQNKVMTENYYHYTYDRSESYPLDFLRIELVKSPADMQSDSILHATIKAAFYTALPVYTDCVNYPAPLSRKTFLSGNKNEQFFKSYALQKADSFDNFFGRVYIYRVRPNNNPINLK